MARTFSGISSLQGIAKELEIPLKTIEGYETEGWFPSREFVFNGERIYILSTVKTAIVENVAICDACGNRLPVDTCRTPCPNCGFTREC